MNKFTKITTEDLISMKETLELRGAEFAKEISDITEELIIRELPYCRPLCDLINTR